MFRLTHFAPIIGPLRFALIRGAAYWVSVCVRVACSEKNMLRTRGWRAVRSRNDRINGPPIHNRRLLI